MNFALTEEQELIVTTVREFCEKEIYPHEDIAVSYTHLTLPTIYSV